MNDASVSSSFGKAFDRFQGLIIEKSGHPFINFDEGLIAVWEDYKPRLRDRALDLLRHGEWSDSEIGSGAILRRIIQAIEIQDNHSNLINNLVFWQNRFGHSNRDHRVLLEAEQSGKLRREIEELAFRLYRDDGIDEGAIFDRVSELTGGKYPLIAYLFFLKDMNRFMPIQPTGFDRAFRELGIDFSTLRQCNWTNYVQYNETLQALRPLIAVAANLKDVRLVDAHSFCWVLSYLLKQQAEGTLSTRGDGRVLGGRERSIVMMSASVQNTVRHSNGQIATRTIKNKELRMTSEQLEKLIASLLDLQGNRCALTGLPFQFHGPNTDSNLNPSVDRIDSNGHYEHDNVQIVCQFINFWKSDSDNEEFKRLLMLVRGLEG